MTWIDPAYLRPRLLRRADESHKGNHVPEGARDYAGVVGMIMTMDKIK